jgi:hypothetical protein
MTRVQTVLITSTAFALMLPFATATAQTRSCGVETWSTDKMAYVNVPCTAGEVGTAGPTAGATSSSSMTKAEMKQGTYSTQPVHTQAVSAGPGYASMANTSCGPSNVTAITDEYGRKYNCRGDRIR